MKKRGYFGLTLWGGLITGDRTWAKSLGLGNNDFEFNPDVEGWGQLLDNLNNLVRVTGLYKHLDLCLHLDSSIPDLLGRFDMIGELNTAVRSNPIPIEMGMHSTFKDTDLILSRDFRKTLKKDLGLCRSIGGTSIVEHPPISRENRIDEMVEELSSEYVVGLLKDYPEICLCWENMPSSNVANRFFGTLGNLLEFRRKLKARLSEIGEPDLINQHLFCLDTGHLIVTYHHNKQKGNQEWLDRLDKEVQEFARHLKVWHIHANDGSADQHLPPDSLEFMNHASRKNVVQAQLMNYSGFIQRWLAMAVPYSRSDVHYHLELLRLPFSLNQISEFACKTISIFEGIE